MIYVNYYISAFKNHFNFDDRFRRKEFWIFSSINFLFLAILAFSAEFTNTTVCKTIFSIFTLLIFIPSLSITVRRLHDIGKSGTWYFIRFIPFGGIWLLILLCKNGQPFYNEYGVDPKSILD